MRRHSVEPRDRLKGLSQSAAERKSNPFCAQPTDTLGAVNSVVRLTENDCAKVSFYKSPIAKPRRHLMAAWRIRILQARRSGGDDRTRNEQSRKTWAAVSGPAGAWE